MAFLDSDRVGNIVYKLSSIKQDSALLSCLAFDIHAIPRVVQCADLNYREYICLYASIPCLFLSVNVYFFHSSKRISLHADNWYSLYSSEPGGEHCLTHWLSLHCVL